MKTVAVRSNRLVTSLEEIRNTPLDLVPADRAAEVVRDVIKIRDLDRAPVDVARFGSSI